MPLFSQNFDDDFGLAVAGLMPDYAGPPYALARFGDGEGAIIFSGHHVAKSDGWKWSVEDNEKSELSAGLDEALQCDLLGWHVGIPAEEHEPLWHARLNVSPLPPDRITFAEIFCFANYRRFADLDLSNCYKVGCTTGADWIVPATPQDDQWPCEIAGAVMWLVNRVRRPIIVSAGPWGKVLIHSYWKATVDAPPGVRQTIIDVGSALSPSLHGRKTRRYHNRRSPQAAWKPRWTV